MLEYSFHHQFQEYKGAKIPLLEQVYSLIQPTNLTINVELKTGLILYEGIEEAVLKLTQDMGMEERVIYPSFNHHSIKKIKQFNPKAQTGLLYGDGFINVPEYGDKMGVNALHPGFYLLQDPTLVVDCKKYKLLLHVWTVNQKKQMKMMTELGVDAMITNYPDVAVQVVKNYANKE